MCEGVGVEMIHVLVKMCSFWLLCPQAVHVLPHETYAKQCGFIAP